jgi:enoyl-CoA hydratase
MSYTNLNVEIEVKIAILTITRPHRLNALDRSTMEEMDQAFQELEADDRVKVVIVTGAGDKAFVAGADINELFKLSSVSDAVYQAEYGQKIFSKIDQFPKPVIMAINGYALGGGCELAMAGDIRIAAENVKLGLPEINLGIFPGWGGTQRLSHIVGASKAKMLIFTGELIGAEEALRIGLVDKVLPSNELMANVKALALKIAEKAPIALRLAKKSINSSIGTDLETGCRTEAACFAEVFSTEDRVEGMRAFLEKKPFVPKGR